MAADLVYTRRAFLKGGAWALVALGAAPRFLVRSAHAAAGRGKVLVAVFQRGGVDGLSMVIPHADPAYFAARPGIALQPPRRSDREWAIDLDGFFALHPALAPLTPFWEARTLAVVHACGSPDATRSHFDAQEYMETGTPGIKSTPDGWLARAVRARPAAASPLRAVSMGSSLPRILRGGTGVVSMQTLGDFGVHQASARQGFELLYGPGGPDPLSRAGREAFESVKLLERVLAPRSSPAGGAEYPRGRFGDSLRQIAQLIRADIGLEIAFAECGGWDTHVGQGNEEGRLANRLREFGATLAAFVRDLGDRMEDVVVLTMTEFGRTVHENGNRGTDHGHATAMLVVGGGIRGGKVYGRWPGLARERLFEERDLALGTDFRALFSEVAFRHLGVPASAVLFPGWTPPAPPLGLFG